MACVALFLFLSLFLTSARRCVRIKRKTAERAWRDGKKEGYGVMTYANGEAYRGEWRDGRRHGHGTMTYEGGDCYVGEWEGGRRYGHGVLTKANGERFEGEFCDPLF